MAVEDREWERDPDPRRPVLSASKAAKRLGVQSYRTVIARIKRSELPGGKFPGRERWWVYLDALPADVPALDVESEHEAVLNRLRGQLRVEQQRKAELLAAASVLSDASDGYRDAAALILEAIRDNQRVVDENQRVLDKALRAAAGFQHSADQFRQVAGHYRNILAEMAVPDDLTHIERPFG